MGADQGKMALVTGAAGFVGANLMHRLVAEDCDVTAIARPGSDLWRLENLDGEFHLATADLRNREEVRSVVASAAPDWVFHLATHGAYSSQRDVGRILETNLIGTVNLLDATLESGSEAFVNSGSSSEYGFKDHAPGESEPLSPNSAYAVGKAAATMYCQHASREHDAHIVTLRLYSVFGPWEEPGRLIPTLVARGLEGELPPLVDPGVARDFVYVDDVVEAYLSAAAATKSTRGSVYNVGTGRQISLREAVDAARSLLDIEAEPDWGSMPERSWDTTTWVADSSLIEQDLGWRPRDDFESGLRATIEWFHERPQLRSRYESRS